MSFNPKVNNAPIYQNFQSGTNGPSTNTSSDWQKYLNQINNKINIGNNYGNPSICLNSDFYWNAGAPPISEKWNLFNSSGTVTVTRTTYPADSSDQTGSNTYLLVQVTGYTGVGDGSDLYLYQQQDGADFLRRYQNRNISMSMGATSNSSSVNTQLQVYIYYDTSSQLLSNSASVIDATTKFYASTVMPPILQGKSIGASPYVQFRLAIKPPVPFSSPANNISFNLNYIKTEMSDIATTLYVDHALERVRIDNS